MSVIVALFLGLSISAEEICRDRKILRRERFLNLSWFSYVNSKLLYLAIVATVQMFLYLIAVNLFITVPEMFLKTYIILLLCAFGASALGLNISAAFRSPITIYILIPLLLIPQILLGGVVVRYAEMISGKSIDRNVPDYATLLFSRWGYEALVVEQYCRNPYMQHFLEADAGIRQAEYNLDHYLPELQSRARSLMILKDRRQSSELAEQADLLKNEIIKLERQTGIPSGIALSNFHPDRYDQTVANAIDEYIRTSRRLIFDRRRQAAVQRREAELRLEGQIGNGGLETLKKASMNRWIQKLVLNHDELEAVGVAKNSLYQKTLPIYQLPESVYGEAHFLASTKRLGKYLIPTFTFNLLMIVMLTFLLCIALYAKILPRLLGSIPKP